MNQTVCRGFRSMVFATEFTQESAVCAIFLPRLRHQTGVSHNIPSNTVENWTTYQVCNLVGHFPCADVFAVFGTGQNTAEHLHHHSKSVTFVPTWTITTHTPTMVNFSSFHTSLGSRKCGSIEEMDQSAFKTFKNAHIKWPFNIVFIHTIPIK